MFPKCLLLQCSVIDRSRHWREQRNSHAHTDTHDPFDESSHDISTSYVLRKRKGLRRQRLRNTFSLRATGFILMRIWPG
jgi:hypothetical protein